MNAEANTEFNLHQVVKVRRLSGLYEVVESWITGAQRNKKRRYRLKAVPNSGTLVSDTESFGEDMQAVTPPFAAELELVPDPEAPNESPAPPAGEFMMDEGAFGGDLDEYSPGAQGAREAIVEEPLLEGIQVVEARYRIPRYAPRDVNELQKIVYQGKVSGTDGAIRPETEDFIPWSVYVTEETNGFIVWVKSINIEDARMELEEFYPHSGGTQARDAAVEHGVLLALRQVQPKPFSVV